MDRGVQCVLLAGAAVVAISVAAHNASPHNGYSGPDIETACEDITIDSDGTLSGLCHAAVLVAGQPYDENNGLVEHIATTIELKDKIRFQNGSLSYTNSGDLDMRCSNISVTVTSTAITLGADCAPEDEDETTAETLDISDNIVVHDGEGEFDWYTAPSTN